MKSNSGYKIEWKDEYSVGVKEIDKQHQKLVDLINKTIDAVHAKNMKLVLESVIDEMEEYVIVHFSTEEKYFKKFKYVNTKSHMQEHKIFVDRVGYFKNKILKAKQEDVLALIYEVIDYLEDWLIRHIIENDQKYIKCFKKHGLS
ncbi:hemerythrin family protein [Candidatus Falkowbacteria bacterium]|jgi:hemerythrin|nr:hemerythrin family protein [Candidatus Falkowbacteria bacterium]MBT4432982.1 hemerythrin family protein [Candidatus Falkowbacteria bacterium]